MEAAERESKLLRARGEVEKACRYDLQNNDVIRRKLHKCEWGRKDIALLMGNGETQSS